MARKAWNRESTGDADQVAIYEIALAVVSIAVVLPYFALALFAHPGNDDFCHIATVFDHGFIGNQIYWYREWSGRFIATLAFSALGGVTRLQRYPLVGLSVLTALFLATLAFVRALSPDVSRFRALTRALPFYALLVATMPVPNQTVYWLSGAYSYQLGNILLLTLLATLLGSWNRGAGGPWRTILAGALGAAAAGCNETLLLVLLVVLGGGVAVTTWCGASQRRAWAVACGGALAASVVVLLSPGNAIRSTLSSEAHRLDLAIPGAVVGGLSYLRARLLSCTSLSAAILALPWARALARRYDAALGRDSRALRFVLVGGWVLLFPIAFAPAWWATGEPPPERALSVLHVIFFVGGLGILLPAFVDLPGPRTLGGQQPWWLRVALGILLAVGLWVDGHLALAVGDLASGRALKYHRDQVTRLALLREYHRAGIDVPQVPSIGSSLATTIATVDIGPDPDDWINKCYAHFYGFRSIALDASHDLLAGFPQAVVDAPAASYVLSGNFSVGHDTLPSLFIHPPSAVQFPPVRASADSVLTFSFGVRDEAWDKDGDGVDFMVFVQGDGARVKVFSRYVDPKHNPEDRRWIDGRVPLGAFASENVRITLATGPGPAGNSSYDWAVWGEPRITLGKR